MRRRRTARATRAGAPGSVGHAAAFSFYPSKNLGALGDGGMITTSDDRAAGRLRLLRNYGQRVKYYHAVPGTNSRLDTLQAAVLSLKLPHLDGWNAARRAHADAYTARLAGHVTTPVAVGRRRAHLPSVRDPDAGAGGTRAAAEGAADSDRDPLPGAGASAGGVCRARLQGRRLSGHRSGGVRASSRCRCSRSSARRRLTTSPTRFARRRSNEQSAVSVCSLSLSQSATETAD